jgi:hypothetical protein
VCGVTRNNMTGAACASCSNKPGNSYYILPPLVVRGFNGASNACPW